MGWACTACTYDNANMQATSCDICSTARSVAVPATPTPIDQERGSSGWACRQCTYVNMPSASRCEICESTPTYDAMMIDDEKVPAPAPLNRSLPAGMNAAKQVIQLPDDAEAKRRLVEAQARERERQRLDQELKARLKQQRARDLAEKRELLAREKRELERKKDAERLEATKQLFEMEERHREETRLARERRDEVERTLKDIPSAVRFMHERYGMEVVKDVLSIISKIVANIIESPGDVKYRTIRMSSPALRNRVESRLGATALMRLLGFQHQQRDGGYYDGQQDVLFMPAPNLPFLQAEYEKMVALLNRPETRLQTILPPVSDNEDFSIAFIMSARKALENITLAPTSSVTRKIDSRSDTYKAFFAPFPPSQAFLAEFQFEFQDPFWVWQSNDPSKLQKAIRDLDKELAKRLANCSIVKALMYIYYHNTRSATTALVEKVQTVLTNVVNDMHGTSKHTVPLQTLLKLTGPIDGLREFFTALGFQVDAELNVARIPYPYQYGIEPYRLGVDIVNTAWKRMLKSAK